MNDIQEGVNTAPVEGAGEVVATPQPISEAAGTSEVAVNEAHSEQKPIEQPKEDRYEKAFAARLRKEQEKWESKFSKHQYVLEKAAAENDVSLDEYLDSLEKNYKEKELESIPKDIREDVLWAREKRANETKEQQTQREEAERTERWNTEVNNLVALFPDIKKASDIPDEVLEWRAKDNVPLEYAYAKYALGKERTKIEQETLKKLQQNEASAVGSMASSSADTKVKISEMSQTDFERLKEEVLRGQRRAL